jgi:hypothetical protein
MFLVTLVELIAQHPYSRVHIALHVLTLFGGARLLLIEEVGPRMYQSTYRFSLCILFSREETLSSLVIAEILLLTLG